MSDEQSLLAILAAIYLIDCIYWIPREGLSVTRWFRNPWKLRFPSTIVGNQNGALGLANPLPPLGIGSRCIGWPFAISAEGIYSRQTGVFFKWSEIKSIARDERKLLINAKFFHKAASPYSARDIAAMLSNIWKSDSAKREKLIRSLIEDTCDPRQVSVQAKRFQALTGQLRLAGNFLFFFLFVVCPFVVWRRGLPATIWPIVIGIYAQTIVIGLLFSSTHRKLYPGNSDQIFKPFLTMLLAAPSAIRAQDILARPLLEQLHPLAVAKALCSESDFERLAPSIIRELQFPALPIVPHEEAFRENLREALISKLQLSKKVPNYLAAPKPTESAHARYCPRCRQQFTKEAPACNDCGGRALLPL